MDQSLRTDLVADASKTETTARRFVRLTQPVESGMDKTASIFDLAQMIARARSGQSAVTYKKNQCPAGVTDTGVNVRLDFEAWPSLPTIAYTLFSNIGAVSPPTIIEEYTEFSLVFGMTDAVELDFMLKDITCYWEIECYDKDWKPLMDVPLPAMDGLTTVRTDQVVFGVVRIRGKKIGARHRLTAQLKKSYPVRPDGPIPEEGISNEDLEKYWAYTDVATWNGEPVDEQDTVDMTGLSLTNLEIIITVKWKNTEGREETGTMPLTIPQCIKDLLAVCDGDLEKFGGDDEIGICNLADNPEQLTVYVSGCSGEEIAVRNTGNNPDDWCET